MPHWIKSHLLKTVNSHHPSCLGILFLLVIPRDLTWSEDTITHIYILLQSTLKTFYTNDSYFTITFLLNKFVNPKGVLWSQIKIPTSFCVNKLTWFCLPHPWRLPEVAGESVWLAAKPHSGFPSLISSFFSRLRSIHTSEDVRFRDACVWWVWEAFHHY